MRPQTVHTKTSRPPRLLTAGLQPVESRKNGTLGTCALPVSSDPLRPLLAPLATPGLCPGIARPC